jgi:hypothetical protein
VLATIATGHPIANRIDTVSCSAPWPLRLRMSCKTRTVTLYDGLRGTILPRIQGHNVLFGILADLVRKKSCMSPPCAESSFYRAQRVVTSVACAYSGSTGPYITQMRLAAEAFELPAPNSGNTIGYPSTGVYS